MRYSHFVFSIDGTLVDTQKANDKTLENLVRKQKDEALSSADLFFILNKPTREMLRKQSSLYLEEPVALLDKNISEFFSDVELYEGIEPMVRRLYEKNYSLGIISDYDRQAYINDFLPFGLGDYFNTVIYSEDTVRQKPFPDPLLKYIADTGAYRENILYIGNTLEDMVCASSLNVDFGLAAWGGQKQQTIPARYSFISPNQVLQLTEP